MHDADDVTEWTDNVDSSVKVYTFDFDLDADVNKTISFNSSLIGIYHCKFYAQLDEEKVEFPER